jgi:putative membrane protein
MREEVYRRARAVFFDRRVHHTAGGSGLLLYVSLFERMAAVIADDVVLEKLGQAAIDEICEQFTRRLHETEPIEAICQTARDVGGRLAPVLPRADDDVNELADALVWMDE